MIKEIKEDQAMKQEFETSPAQGGVPVRFAKDDLDDPFNWGLGKKMRMFLCALAITYVSAFNASANGTASSGFIKDHEGVTSNEFQVTSFTYLVMLGIGPLILAPVSETFGRRPQLVICTFIIMLLFIPMALAPNIYALIFSRLVQGTCACIEGPTAAGVVADLFPKLNRGIPMGFFVLTVFTANATRPTVASWVAFKTGWANIYWLQMATNGAVFLYTLFFFKECRGEVILRKRCKQLTQETGQRHYVEGADSDEEGWLHMLKISVSRPLLYLFTEPIVAALSLVVGFAWGTVFLFIGAISHVFTENYGFNAGTSHTVLICGFIGAAIGCVTNIFIQEPIYQKAVQHGGGRAKPEVRLYSAGVGSILFSVSLFCFAWTARPWIHWIVPCIFIVLANSGIYSMYLATYSYFADTYMQYSSSAQAAQSLLRNVLGATFPFFGVIMYDTLTFPIASSLLGAIAAVMAGVIWLLIIYGARLRARSRIAVSLQQQEGEVLSDHDNDHEVDRPMSRVDV
ncbi:uncharacterized protein JCM6883_004264 [Sporobolomyces salmoneus]|uniref:uncharacterized protein n=1 Tax=Sporobolomyces salmoneus TaxID=183962 RepID=UPI00317E12E4